MRTPCLKSSFLLRMFQTPTRELKGPSFGGSLLPLASPAPRFQSPYASLTLWPLHPRQASRHPHAPLTPTGLSGRGSWRYLPLEALLTVPLLDLVFPPPPSGAGRSYLWNLQDRAWLMSLMVRGGLPILPASWLRGLWRRGLGWASGPAAWGHCCELSGPDRGSPPGGV